MSEVIISDLMGLRCRHLSIKRGFVIPDWGGPAWVVQGYFSHLTLEAAVRPLSFKGIW